MYEIAARAAEGNLSCYSKNGSPQAMAAKGSNLSLKLFFGLFAVGLIGGPLVGWNIANRAEARTIDATSAEFACMKAYKKTLKIKDGYKIPLGSVRSSVLVSRPDYYVVKWPYSVKNAFGARVKGAAECVISKTREITELRKLY